MVQTVPSTEWETQKEMGAHAPLEDSLNLKQPEAR